MNDEMFYAIAEEYLRLTKGLDDAIYEMAMVGSHMGVHNLDPIKDRDVIAYSVEIYLKVIKKHKEFLEICIMLTRQLKEKP